MRSDEEIKRDVEQELKYDPDINPIDIAVSVKDGAVTLTGFVRSYRQIWPIPPHNPKVAGSNPAPATKISTHSPASRRALCFMSTRRRRWTCRCCPRWRLAGGIVSLQDWLLRWPRIASIVGRYPDRRVSKRRDAWRPDLRPIGHR